MRLSLLRNVFSSILFLTLLGSTSIARPDDKPFEMQQLYSGARRPASELVTIVLGGPYWDGKIPRISIGPKGVGLRKYSQVLPGTYTVGITMLCGYQSRPIPSDAIAGWGRYSTTFTAAAGETVTFIAQGGSFSVETERGIRTCYGQSFPHTISGSPAYLDSSTVELKKLLPSEAWTRRSGPPSESPFAIPGTASPFRITNNARLEFVFKSIGEGIPICKDATINLTKPRLFHFTSNKGTRELDEHVRRQLMTSGTTGLNITTSTVNESSCKVIAESLEPGEYGLEIGDLVFTFGVDGSAK